VTTEHETPNLQVATKKLSTAQSLLNEYVLERREETRGILLAVLSGTNALFLGDVGTAKTHHISTASTLLGLSFFDILMSETTKPDQLFGPVDIPALAQGRQVFKYEDYAPGCNILFFDEIFKANATTLNPLLWLMNEHKFRDGDNGIIECPTYSVFAASNEVPTDPTLKAVYDRMLLRFNVTYIKSDNNLHKLVSLLTDGKEKPRALLSREEIDLLRAHVKTISIGEDIVNTAIKVRRQVENTMGYKLSDRRFLSTFRVMQANAVLRGDTKVKLIDVEVMVYVCWNEINQQKRVENIVYASTSAEVVEVSTYMEQVEELRKKAARIHDLKKVLKELKRIHGELKQLSSRYARRCASEVAESGKQIAALIQSRKVIEGVLVSHEGGKRVFKMHTQYNLLWAAKELRAMGLRHKRKADYWYTANLKGTQRLAQKQGVVVKVSDAGKK
jgi:MoxR-like ATPase